MLCRNMTPGKQIWVEQRTSTIETAESRALLTMGWLWAVFICKALELNQDAFFRDPDNHDSGPCVAGVCSTTATLSLSALFRS